MSNKSVPFSVRLSQEDAEYVAALEIPGAITPSDKIRHIISEARKKNSPVQDFNRMLERFREELQSTSKRLNELERESNQESDFMHYFADWLAHTCAEYATGPETAKELQKHEARIVRQVAKLTEHTMRLAVTSDAPCYDPQVIQKGIRRSVELAKFIESTQDGDLSHE